jgi:long-chain acyl-CoA synthetase
MTTVEQIPELTPDRARPWLAHYEAAVPTSIEVPPITVDALLREAARNWPDRSALVFFNKKTSFAELDGSVDRFAHALVRLGVKPGDRVSIHLPTTPAFVIAFMGALRAGAIAVPMNPLYVPRELSELFEQTRPAVSVTMDVLVPRLGGLEGAGRPGRLVTTGIQDSLPVPIKWLYPLKARREGRWNPQRHTPEQPQLFRLLRESPSTPFPSSGASDDPAVLQPTGGTTGIPKAATLTHRNLVANALQVAAWLPDAAGGEGFSVLCPLPLFHIYGLTVDLNYAMVKGATLLLLPRFDAVETLKTIAKYKPRLFPGAPIMYQTLGRHPEAWRYDLRSIEACISGAAPLAPDVQFRFEEITGGRVVEGYGLSEASPVTHCNPVHGDRRNGTIGLPFPSTDARIMDLETGTREMPLGEVGELWVRGPQVMAGYWERPDETADVLRDGWLRTGDLATVDADGYFTIVDRAKDLIIVGGLNVYPREVEEVLIAHEAVSDAAVIGKPEERHGELPHAYVTLLPGATVTPDELIAHCRANLSRYKVPASIEIRDELPKTMIGKVLRKNLRAEESDAG